MWNVAKYGGEHLQVVRLPEDLEVRQWGPAPLRPLSGLQFGVRGAEARAQRLFREGAIWQVPGERGGWVVLTRIVE